VKASALWGNPLRQPKEVYQSVTCFIPKDYRFIMNSRIKF